MRYRISVYYYQSEKSYILSACLLPLISSLKEKFGLYILYAQKHWKFGPHIRLILDADESQLESIKSFIIHEVDAFLAKYPSKHQIDEIIYEKQSEKLGTLELESGPYLPLRPDNSVFIESCIGEVDILGGEQQVNLKDKLLSYAMPMVEALLYETLHDKENRLAYILQMMVMLAEQYPNGGIMRGHLSYRSHLEDYLFEFDKQNKLRDYFKKKFDSIQEEVVSLVKNTLNELEHGQYIGENKLFKKWSDVLQYFWSQSYAYAERKEIIEEAAHLQQVAEQINEQAQDKWSWTEREYSSFHQSLRQFNHRPERLDTVNFSAYRWNVNMFYILLPLFDISPSERYYLCYLLLESVENVLGLSWNDIMTYAKYSVEGDKAHETKVQ